jgi:hypothetical protein
MYDWKKEQLRRELNKEYFEVIKKKKGVYVSPQELFLYRLCVMFTVGSIIGIAIAKF